MYLKYKLDKIFYFDCFYFVKIILVKESLKTIDKLNLHLAYDRNDTLVGTHQNLNSIIDFVVNISDVFYRGEFDSSLFLRNITEVSRKKLNKTLQIIVFLILLLK